MSNTIPGHYQSKTYSTRNIVAEVHLSCDHPFDGPGGVVAHSYICTQQRCVHIDEDECYRSMESMSGSRTMGCIYLLQVALHEIGHVLGLGHFPQRDSIMYPMWQPLTNDQPLELSREERSAAQDIWGICGGVFDSVFDLIRKHEETKWTDDGFPTKTLTYSYKSYFFRGEDYWMYENRNNRPRYGDPLYISAEWPGLTSDIDAAVQILYDLGELNCGERNCPPLFDIHTYFFKGEFNF